MIRKILIFVGLIVAIVLAAEIIGLVTLRAHIGSYRSYWLGRANQPGDFVYVALGDSAAQGIGASQPQNSYVGLIADTIEKQTGRSVRVINLSVTGATVQDAIKDQLPQLEKFTPDLVTVEIGANDMRTFNASTFAKQYDQFLQALPPGRSVISNMPYFGSRPASEPNALQANQIILATAQKYNLPVGDLHGILAAKQSRLDQKLLTYAPDFFHPNDRAYRYWYQAFEPGVTVILK